jgi:hypothetical protein
MKQLVLTYKYVRILFSACSVVLVFCGTVGN